MTAADDAGRPVALVTGGGGDIGRAIALRLGRMSRAVAIVDIDRRGGGADRASGGGGWLQGDGDPGRRFQSASRARGFVDAVEAGFGPIGIFANNAGDRRRRSAAA